MKKILMSLITALAISGAARTAEKPAPQPKPAIRPEVERLLKTSGAVSYSSKENYGGGIAAMYIGYDKDDKPTVCVALRETKTYKKTTALVAITPTEGAYKVAAAEIPDIETFQGKSKNLAADTLKDIVGRLFKSSAEARGLVDAVTGATQYRQAIYVSYAIMASKAIEELTANPAWPRYQL